MDDLLKLTTDNLDFQLLQLIITTERKAIEKANAIIDYARKIISKAELKKLLDLIETIVIYKLPTLNREDIKKMLNVTDAELKGTQFYKDVFDEGKEEGKEEGEFNLTLLACKARYGEIEAKITNQLKQLKHEQLKILLTLLVTNVNSFSLNDLKAWLKTQL